MSWHRASVVTGATVLLLAVLAGVGRWERARQIRAQAAGMRTVLRLIGPLDNRTLAGFRELPTFDCLTYRRGADPLALEVCVDAAGRVVQAVDRRDPTHRRFWTLQYEPTASPVRAARARVVRLVKSMEAR
jgi:hypothetical protein